ncbi:hypothetical protein HNP52_001112 [Sphingomonas kyeonggiensis]|uniref:Uncharacterized protein n=1 Tax=Sphingomonas kyeonggiensis TaxID=1268553 RepID=A0A7W7JZ63_9SPHN|nr:hypothetical protein [Sphingomonas kyeonggiensis]MBB4838061.1 hypothetical protein [Sphingomonas kyeonggiensis]
MEQLDHRIAFDPALSAGIDPLNLPAVAQGGAVAPPDARPLTPLDEHGHYPDDYEWVPVRRKHRHDGWSPERQRDFIEALADRGSVTEAARQVGMSVGSAYKLRRSPGGENFARAWEIAIHHAANHLADLAFDRAIHGSDEPVFDKEGRRVGRRMRINDRLLMFLLRAHLPERYAHAHRDTLPAGAVPYVPPMALADALAALAPVQPADPAAGLSAEELEYKLEIADLAGDKLPRWLYEKSEEEQDTPSGAQLAIDAHFDAELDRIRGEGTI